MPFIHQPNISLDVYRCFKCGGYFATEPRCRCGTDRCPSCMGDQVNATEEARAKLERSNRSLALVLGNPTVKKVFQITKFDESFEIYPSLGAAAGRDANAAGNDNGHI